MTDDVDFPFTFGNVSDGEEEEGLFVDKVATKKRAALQAGTEAYQPQIEGDEWLLQCLKDPVEAMYQKNGANKRYEEAYEVARLYCQVVRENGSTTTQTATHDRSFKVTDCRDLQEMMARAALKLGRAEDAAQIVDSMTSPDAGFVFLKATVYKAARRYNEAVKCLVDFQQTRSSNYAIWRQMAECLYPYHGPSTISSSTSTPWFANTASPTSSLALISISRSRFLMEAASWPTTGFGHVRYIRELKHIKEMQEHIEQYALKIEPRLKDTDKVAYDRMVEAPIEAWRALDSCEEQESLVGNLDRSVIDYICETWVQTLKGDGSGAISEYVEEADATVKAVRDM
ncbi:hypothetical protein DFQ26_007078 [Actinomortierella ambigua]|nr:hypothetical protein DFQ26_007078 [Actinomortierella ambigua]